MLTGTDFANQLLTSGLGKAPLAGVDRENFILKTFAAFGLCPIGGGSIFSKIVSKASISGKTRTVEMFCSPLPMAFGTSDDPFLIPAWPWTYQAIASQTDCVLPTRKMCLLVAQQAVVRVEPHPYSASDGGFANESSGRYVQSNGQCLHDLSILASAGQYSPGNLVSGLKKDVVIGPHLDGSHVAIFGWFHASGPQDDSSAGRWQPYSTIHESAYADYSHSFRVFKNRCLLDGAETTLKSLCADKLLWPLVSDHGPFLLEFPNQFPSVSAPTGFTGLASTSTKSMDTASALGKAKMLATGAAGGVLGFAVGGPVGAAFGAALGVAIGRGK